MLRDAQHCAMIEDHRAIHHELHETEWLLVHGALGAGDIRKDFFAGPFPVTTTVQIERLYHPELMIEIAAIAEIPRDRFHHPEA